jgi:hypothetical protein
MKHAGIVEGQKKIGSESLQGNLKAEDESAR